MKKIHLLIVDDHPIISEGLEFFLGQEPHLKIIGTAANGKEGLERLRALFPDVVILDLSLPDMDGYQAIRLFREAHPSVKILIFSAHTEENFVYQALQAGAHGYVVKRGSFDDLKQAIYYIREGGYWVSPEFSPNIISNYLQSLQEKDSEKSLLSHLTSREEQVFRLIVAGMETHEIRDMLYISEKTVAKHRNAILKKLDVKNTIELTRLAIRNGLIEA